MKKSSSNCTEIRIQISCTRDSVLYKPLPSAFKWITGLIRNSNVEFYFFPSFLTMAVCLDSQCSSIKIKGVYYFITPNLGCVHTGSDNVCVRARVRATNYPFVK